MPSSYHNGGLFKAGIKQVATISALLSVGSLNGKRPTDRKALSVATNFSLSHREKAGQEEVR
jgi:hypothetical protein